MDPLFDLGPVDPNYKPKPPKKRRHIKPETWSMVLDIAADIPGLIVIGLFFWLVYWILTTR